MPSLMQRWRVAARWHNTRAVLVDGARPVGTFLLGVIVAFAVGWVFRRNPSTAVSVAGLVLELLGIAVVARGIVQLRRRFKRPSWFARLLTALQRPGDNTIQIKAGVMGVSGLGTVTAVGNVATPTIEQRLDALEATTTQLRTDLTDTRQALTASIDTVASNLRRETDERAAAIRDVLHQLEDVSAGGLRLESLGLTWLVVGVLLTTVPNELATWLTDLF